MLLKNKISLCGNCIECFGFFKFFRILFSSIWFLKFFGSLDPAIAVGENILHKFSLFDSLSKSFIFLFLNFIRNLLNEWFLLLFKNWLARFVSGWFVKVCNKIDKQTFE